MSTYNSVGLTTTTAVPLGQGLSPFEAIKSTPVPFELHTASALFVKNVLEMTDKLVWFWGNKLSVYLIVIGRRTQDGCLFSDEGLHYVIQTSLSVCPYWTSLKSLCTYSPTSSRLTHYRPCSLGRSTPQYRTPQRSTRHWRRPACCWHSALVHRDSANIPTTACLAQWMGGCFNCDVPTGNALSDWMTRQYSRC